MQDYGAGQGKCSISDTDVDTCWNYFSKCGDSYNDSAWKYGAGRDEKEDHGFLCDAGKKALSGAWIYFLRLDHRNFYVSSDICNGRGILFPERV